VWFTKGNTEQYHPAWSPDGKWLVYGAGNALVVSAIDGSATRQLTTCAWPPCSQDVDPAWSSDGAEIAFARSIAGVRQILVVSSQGGQPRQLTTGPDEHAFPSW
jgi:TolB protein